MFNPNTIAGFSKLLQQARNELNFKTINIQEITAGLNNRIFCLSDPNNQKLVAKFYYRDDRPRLENEYNAINFMRENGIFNVPEAFIKNDFAYAAVYSFVFGQPKQAKDLIKKDIKNIASFLVKLHKIPNKGKLRSFPRAAFAVSSYQEFVDNIHGLVNKLEGSILDENTDPQVLGFLKKISTRTVLNNLISDTLKGLPSSGIVKSVNQNDLRFCPIDFGSHNILFNENKDLTFIDFEASGLDDPAKVVADFLYHDRSRSISDDLKKYFIDTYLVGVNFGANFKEKLKRYCQLMQIEWLARYLVSVTPEKLKIKEFSEPNFNRSVYIEGQLQKFDTALKKLT